MTISSDTRQAGPFLGDGVQTVFPFTYKVFTAADVLVVKTDADGAESNQTLTTHYTVSLNADQNANPGGTVTMLTAPAAGEKLTLTSEITAKQLTQIPNLGGFFPEVLTNALDKLTILVQQLINKTDRSIKYPISDGNVDTTLPTSLVRASSVLGFDATGKWKTYDPASAVTAAGNVTATDGSGGSLFTTVQGALTWINGKFAELWAWTIFASRYETLQAAIDATPAGGTLTLAQGQTYDITATLTRATKIRIDGNGSTIRWLTGNGSNMLDVSADFECHNVRWVGGTAGAAVGAITTRAIYGHGSISRFVVRGCEFEYFATTGVYVESSELLGAIVRNIDISHNKFLGHADQLQAITCFGGDNVAIANNIIDGCDSVAILCDDATSVTPLSAYGRLRNVVIADNVVHMPGANNGSVNYGIQTCAAEGLTITGNVITNNGALNSAWGIVASIYDLGQQAVAPGGGAAYLPISEDSARTVIANNAVYNVGRGLVVEGYRAPSVVGNNVTCTAIGIYIDNEAGTVNGVALDFPTGASNANVSSNVIVAKNAAAVGIRMDTQGNYCLDNTFVGTFAKRYETVGVPALTTQHINDADRDPSFATVYSRNVADLTVSGRLAQGTRCIRKLVDVVMPDNVATTIATITTTDETGTNDGGAFMCFVHLMASHTASNNTSNCASKAQSVMFGKAQIGAGNAALSAVTTVATSGSAATTPATRDIGTVSVTLNAASAYATEVQATVDMTGSSASNGRVTALIELIYTGYTTAPVIA